MLHLSIHATLCDVQIYAREKWVHGRFTAAAAAKPPPACPLFGCAAPKLWLSLPNRAGVGLGSARSFKPALLQPNWVARAGASMRGHGRATQRGVGGYGCAVPAWRARSNHAEVACAGAKFG